MRRRRHNRPKPKVVVKQRYRVNEQIMAPAVVVITESGENLGTMTPEAGIALARERELDLVEVSPQAVPPVCRLTDYGKLQYHAAKQAQAAKAKQKKVETKGVRLGYRTEKHDLFFKKTQAEKFMMKGHKVKIDMMLRGREKAMADKAKEILSAFATSIAVPHKIEENITKGPRGFSMIIAPE
ncbi:MAG: translation initiation factor IF-3 [Candidatus Moraniibacteriota bacterium]|nr:MAG: translation initiation factor IF-3 [Candidatus Moranbacteria bacterium]